MRNSAVLAMVIWLGLSLAGSVCKAGDRGSMSLGKARAEISILDDDERAKVDLEETKRRRDQFDMDQTDQLDNSQCGTVQIGNGNSGSQSGSGRVAPRDTTVIVTGNIFNTASCGH